MRSNKKFRTKRTQINRRTKRTRINRRNKRTKRTKRKNHRTNKLKGGSLYGPLEQPCPRDMNWREEIPQCVGSCKPQDQDQTVLKFCKECKKEFKQATSRRWWTEPDRPGGEQFRRHYCRACGETVCEGCAVRRTPEYNCEVGEDLKRNQWVCGTCHGMLVEENSMVRKVDRKSRGSPNFEEWDTPGEPVNRVPLHTSAFVRTRTPGSPDKTNYKDTSSGSPAVFGPSPKNDRVMWHRETSQDSYPVEAGDWRNKQDGMLARESSRESVTVSEEIGSSGSGSGSGSGGSGDSEGFEPTGRGSVSFGTSIRGKAGGSSKKSGKKSGKKSDKKSGKKSDKKSGKKSGKTRSV
jgi:hypothetical protein